MRLTQKILVQLIASSMVLSALNLPGSAGAHPRWSTGRGSILAPAEDDFALPEAKVGAPYEYQFQTEGGLAPLTWQVVQGALPPGIRLEAAGKLLGAPTQAQREAYRFVIEVSDSSQPAQKFSQVFLLTVKAPPLRIVTNRQALRIVNSGSNGAAAGTPQTTPNPAAAGQPISPAAPPGTVGTGPADNSSSTSGTNAPRNSPAASRSPADTRPSDSEDKKIVICGRLRPASIDQSLSLIRSLPGVAATLEVLQAEKDEYETRIVASQSTDDATKREELIRRAERARSAKPFAEDQALRIAKRYGYSEKEIKYLAGLWDRIARSRFEDNCSENRGAGNGEQKNAVVALLQWFLEAKNPITPDKDRKAEIDQVLSEAQYSKLSDETIRKQITLLNQYIGNVSVRLKSIGGTVSTQTDKDGNFRFEVHPRSLGNSANLARSASTPSTEGSSAQTETGKDLYTFTLSTEGDDEQTKAEIAVTGGECLRVNLGIEDRPVSLLARSIIGMQQSAATAAQPETNVFLDLFFRSTFPTRQRIDPDFGERTQLWSAMRVASVPQPSNISIKDSATQFQTNVGRLKLNEVGQVFDFLGGIEVRLPGLSSRSLLPSFAGDTKQKFSLSLIASYGFITVPELSQTARVYAISPDFIQRSKLPAERFAGKEMVAFVEEDRDRFFRQYYFGLRAQTFFFNRHNIPIQRFPAQFDFQWGQNEYVTGGQTRGSVLRFDGYFPLPYEKAKFINLFGMAIMRPVRVKTNIEPLVLRPIFTAENNGVFDTSKVFDPKTLVLGVQHFNRDYYKVGVGIDLISFFQSILSLR